MATACCVICPAYTGTQWPPLPRLTAAVDELVGVLRDHEVGVDCIVADSPDAILRALRTRAQAAGQLVVYVGGHGVVEGGEHYTALNSTGDHPDSLDAIWARQLATVLSSSAADVVLFVDTCFSGQATVALQQALTALADSPTRKGFGLVAACRAFTTTDDGRFLETLLELMREGPRADATAWGPNDESIRLGALVKELDAAGVQVDDVGLHSASELRLLPNPRYDPGDLPGRVHVKLRLRRLSAGAETHLLEKSEGFVGRAEVRRRIADWLESAPGGMFVVTGGPGTGKSALMGLLARQSVGDLTARSVEGPCVAENAFDVIVHARQKTTEEVAAELASVRDSTSATVLVDAVDEAVAGEAIGIAAHLRSLARRPGLRLVVGSRPSPVVSTRSGVRDPLLAELRPDETADLATLKTTTADIEELLRGVLSSPDSPYAGADVGELAAEVAQRTTPSFLFAHTAARWLTGQVPITGRADWRQRVARFGTDTTVGALIDEDLAARFTSEDLVRVRDLLRALAWAEGLGLPRYTIWPEFAQALSPVDAAYGDPDITWVLNEAGWYITEAGEDGQTVYRLFHQALVDWFREETRRGR